MLDFRLSFVVVGREPPQEVLPLGALRREAVARVGVVGPTRARRLPGRRNGVGIRQANDVRKLGSNPVATLG